MLLAGKPQAARDAATAALAFDPSQRWIEMNKAHAMLSGDAQAARSLYLSNRGIAIPNGVWENIVRSDFVALRKAGQTTEIEAAFAAPGVAPRAN